MSQFAITRGKGFHMTFANGWTVSVQFGYGNYCSNRNIHGEPAPSATAEIAAWDARGEWHEFESGDTVEGWKTPDEVLAFMQMIAAKESVA